MAAFSPGGASGKTYRIPRSLGFLVGHVPDFLFFLASLFLFPPLLCRDYSVVGAGSSRS
uniref:Uncharacterized protein n=1 Tax=Arundo donax TaxID=35708 RepID=A0A0A9FBY5_ARUDO